MCVCGGKSFVIRLREAEMLHKAALSVENLLIYMY